MASSQQINPVKKKSSGSGKSSLTFESVVCSQLELKRRAEAASRRRSTLSRRSIPYPMLSSYSTARRSVPFDINRQFTRRNRASSAISTNGVRLINKTDRPSMTSISYWDTLSRSETNVKEGSQWSIDFPKETPLYWSLRTRLIEEYTESESLVEFAKKTTLVLMKTRKATIILGFILILPIIMMGIGVSHLADCPRQTNLPIYLFVSGIVWTVKLLQNIWFKYRLRQKSLVDEEPSTNHNDGHIFIDRLLTAFLIVWFCFGQYWFITLGYPPHFEQLLKDPDIWCHKTVVYCAFASIIITYFLLITFASVVLFLVCFTRYTMLKSSSTS